MELHLIAFTARGWALAQTLAQKLGGSAVRGGPGGVRLQAWTEQHFAADGLIFVGAAGIAVRAVAPFVRSKTTDPAVVVVDENGRWAVPVLSGHLGGANALAQRIADEIGAQAVITTATDGRGAFAADTWARSRGLQVMNARNIKRVSAAVLAGETVLVRSRWKIGGAVPSGLQLTDEPEKAQLVIDWQPPAQEEALWLCPPLFLGLGCRKNTPPEALEEAFVQSGLPAKAVAGAGSIDVKQNEAGLLAFCAAHGWPVQFFSAAALAEAPGQFTASAFVKQTVGVDNVCERAALLAAGHGAQLLLPKQAGGGVTLAAAAPLQLYWSENDEGKCVESGGAGPRQ